MNLSLWIITGVLAAAFSVAGISKVFVPKEKLAAAPGGAWVLDFSGGSLKAIGALELVAVAGLILPAALDIAAVLVPLAAAGLALVMTGAISMRLRRREGFKAVLVDAVYLAVAVFVAWGRFGPGSFIGS